MKITTVGIDLAKNIFQVHGVDERGKAVLRKQLRRAQVAVFFANLPPCVIGMEACASAHGWLSNLLNRRHPNIAAVALANKNVRTVWALLAHGRVFRADYAPQCTAA
jgi:transposase